MPECKGDLTPRQRKNWCHFNHNHFFLGEPGGIEELSEGDCELWVRFCFAVIFIGRVY